MRLRTDDFDYVLPDELIAARPLARREDSRMLVVDRADGGIAHRMFRDFPEYIRPGDLCVFNDSRVVPARVFADDGRVEILRVAEPEPLVWHCLVKPGRRMRPGMSVAVAGVRGMVEAMLDDGLRRVRWDGAIDLEAHGRLALPPYMHREQEDDDRERYQTVFAARPGSVAAPTAGLHFTPGMLAALPHVFVTLHVGIGTFRPVSAEYADDHTMHAEHYAIDGTAAAAINAARRVVAIGTTSTRVLEAAATAGGLLLPGHGETSIFIKPPHTFQRVGALLTNFHLPKSTLLMLVSAFAGTELIREAYRQAVANRYRFFSYGDCMLIV